MTAMQRLELQPLEASNLYNRRTAQHEQSVVVVGGGGDQHLRNGEQNGGTRLESVKCARCRQGFQAAEPIVNTKTAVFHTNCFLCAQCFRTFANGVYFDVNGRMFCEHDFQMLYAPSCANCHKFIYGRVIKALNSNWHPECFRCELCDVELADSDGFNRNLGRVLCRDCNAKEKASALGKYICYKCRGMIDEGPLKYRMETYHPYHFNCKQCSTELRSDARVFKDELYCSKCFDRMCAVCAACKRPIDDARVVHAVGKQWHHEHFVCAVCEKPFMGTRYYQKHDKAYCLNDFQKLFGKCCFKCSALIPGDCLEVFSKCWCRGCFSCTLCDKPMDHKTKFYDFDARPICKKCYERFPKELQKRLMNKNR